MNTNLYMLTLENEEEVLAVNDFLLKIREERQKEEMEQKCKMAISDAIADSISKIGLNRTKTITRALVRELKELE